MKTYSFDEMVARFGLGYTYEVPFNAPSTVIIKQAFKGMGSFPKVFDTKEMACNAFKAHRLEDIVKSMDELEQALKHVGFLSRIFNRTNIKNAEEKLSDWKKKKAPVIEDLKIEHVQLDPNSEYRVFVPELEVGDKVYVAITSENVLKEGVYEQTITEKKYFLNLDKSVEVKQVNEDDIKVFDLLISYSVETEGEKLSNTLTKKMDVELDTDFHNGYTYHSTRISRDEAVSYFNEKMREKIAYYQSKIIS